MKTRILFLVVALGVSGCAQPAARPQPSDTLSGRRESGRNPESARHEVPSAVPQNSYFPKGSISDAGFAKFLAAMGEPVLLAEGKEQSYVAFRLLFLPTFARPVAVRIENGGGEISIRSVLLSGDGGFDPGKILQDRTERVSDAQFARFHREMEASGIWTLAPQDGVHGFDGNTLIVEAIKDGRHAIVVRWMPDYETEKRQLSGMQALTSRLLRETGFSLQR